jgi:predicted Zn-dependent protease
MNVRPLNPRWVLAGTGLALLGLLAAPKQRHAEPFTPSPSEVVGRTTPGLPRAAVSDLPGATEQARALIVASRRAGGDPRLLGRAQAVLAPWWSQPDLPAETRLVRATIRQSFHDFPAALVDLDAIVAASPDDAQAWLTRATVLQVLSRLDEARESCARLRDAPPLVTTVCRAQVDGLSGHAAAARDALTAALPSARPDERSWALSVLGDLTLWAGDAKAAVTRYQQALEADPTDEYTRGALADLLLDLKRPAEVVVLLREHPAVDAQVLRLAIAGRDAHDEHAAQWLADITERVEAARARQDVVHRREEARFTLELEHDATHAVQLAVANFAVQREPADARILLEAATAAKQPEAARPALEWLARTGFEDPTLRALGGGARP